MIMSYKKVCLSCKKAFSGYQKSAAKENNHCPECGNEKIVVNHKFQPPKKSNHKKWKVVAHLLSKGFDYEHVYEEAALGGWCQYGRYPEEMYEVEDFINAFNTER